MKSVRFICGSEIPDLVITHGCLLFHKMYFIPTIIATQRIIRKHGVTLVTARGPNAKTSTKNVFHGVSGTLDFLLSYRQLLSHTMFSDIGKSIMKLML